MLENIIEKIIERKLGLETEEKPTGQHPAVGKRCIVRTYSAGVHFGLVTAKDGTEVYLTDAYRLWRWEGGGLSLSAVNLDGMKGGRINRTGEVYLTQVIELIPMSAKFEETYVKFVE